MRRRLFACLLLAFAAGSGCERRPAEPLQVATNVWPGYEPLYLARQLRALDPARFRLVEMPNATDALRALRAGMVSAAALTLDETLTLLQEGVDLRIAVVLDVSNGADALVARPGLGSLRGLKGRRIGVEHSAVGAYMLARALERAGLDAQDVETVRVTENGHLEAYRSGAVDAVVTFDPSRSRLIALGAEPMFDSSQIPEEIFDVLVVRTEVLRAHPEVAPQLREAWFRALDHLQREPEDAARRMAPREGVDPSAFQASLRGLEFPNRDREQQLRSGALLAPARRLAETMLRHRLLKRPVDPSILLAQP